MTAHTAHMSRKREPKTRANVGFGGQAQRFGLAMPGVAAPRAPAERQTNTLSFHQRQGSHVELGLFAILRAKLAFEFLLALLQMPVQLVLQLFLADLGLHSQSMLSKRRKKGG